LHLDVLVRNHAAAMNTHQAFMNYYELAKAADDASSRAVYMLGMLCAQAVAVRKFVSFAKGSIGSGWPDARFSDRTAYHYRRTRER
jgi:hypothetical protein